MGQCWAITFSSKSSGFGQNSEIMMFGSLAPFPGWKLGFCRFKSFTLMMGKCCISVQVVFASLLGLSFDLC